MNAADKTRSSLPAVPQRAACGGRTWRKPPLVFLFLLVLLAPGQGIQAQEENSQGEYQLKAAFLFNFAKFIDWPPTSFATATAPFTICTLGPDPFGHDLDDSLRGKTVGSRPIVIRRCQSENAARGCQILFVSRSEGGRVAEILGGLHGTNILVVGESEGFAARGGMIEFVLQEDHVRFRINPDAAARAGLTISSKLLALATIVHSGYNNGKS